MAGGIPNNLLYRPVMAPNPNIPFEVYLDMIGRPRYPPLGNVQANLLVRPKPLMFFPYNAMLVSNSMTIRPYPMNMVHPSIRENPKETSHMDARTAATTAATATTTARPLIEMKSTNIKKYKCQFCGRGFSRSNTLITHERIHTGEKPFECQVCRRKFRQHGNLTRHMVIHTNMRPFSCVICKRAFNRKSNLKTHLKIHRLPKLLAET